MVTYVCYSFIYLTILINRQLEILVKMSSQKHILNILDNTFEPLVPP